MLVRAVIHVSPVWSRHRRSRLTFALRLFLDAFIESPRLVAEAITAYWNAGALRILRAQSGYQLDASVDPALAGTTVVIGRNDRLVDPTWLKESGAKLIELDGAHGIVDSHPRELAEAIRNIRES